jgi:uncharacterized tellurite resistance protein B-like protein
MNEGVAKCLLLSKVLVADGVVTENEREFLKGAMRHFGLTDEEQRQVVDLEGWDEAEAVCAALTMEAKRELMVMVVDAASADGRLSPLEVQTVKRITAALGLD